MSKARNLSKVIVDSSGIVSRNSLDVETVAKTGSYNDLTNKPTITSGTVTSVAATVPTGLSVSGSPVTSSGTLAISYASGYSIPTDVKQSNWDTAYSWGNHASAGYQAGDADLTAIAALSGTSGFLKKTAANTWSLDTNTYLTSAVTSVTGTSPISSSGGNTPAISISQSNTTTNGYLSSTDWNTFNGKQDVLVSGTNIKTVGGVSLLGSGDVGTLGVGYGGTGLTSLTAGYIPFGNGTSAFGSSSNFYWDNTNARLGVGTTSPSNKLTVSGTGTVGRFISSNTGVYLGLQTSDANGVYLGSISNSMVFQTADTERMRIDSSGNVGIGTSSPSASTITGRVVDIVGSGPAGVRAYSGGVGVALIYNNGAETSIGGVGDTTAYLTFKTGNLSGTERMRLDSSGNLGLGVTPSAWGSGSTAFDITGGLGAYGNGISHNAYFNGTAWTYKSTNVASLWLPSGGQHRWYTAPSGTAGTAITFTQAMTLDGNGNLGLGEISPNAGNGVWLNIKNAAQQNIRLSDGSNNFDIVAASGIAYVYNRANGALVFGTNNTERMRIDSSGNVGIGTSSPDTGSRLTLDRTTNNNILIRASGVDKLAFYADASISAIDAKANPLSFYAGSAERMRIDSSGNVGLGVTPSAWGNVKAFESTNAVSLYSRTDGPKLLGLSCNSYFNGTNNIYKTSDFASQYIQYAGTHIWQTAGSGTAGNAITFTQAMTLDASGRLGIGITSPSYRLDVVGVANNTPQLRLNTGDNNTSDATYNMEGGSFAFYQRQNGSTYQRFLDIVGNGDSTWGSVIRFLSNANGSASATERMRIDSSGNLLVGTTSNLNGSPKLAVKYSSINGGLTVENASAPSGFGMLAAITYQSASASDLAVLIGSGNGSGYTTNNLFIRTNGNVQNTNNSYGSISDIKVKENIVDATPKLEKLNQVRIVNYNLIGDTNKQIGVVAQELEQIFPSMVDEVIDRDSEGNDLGTTTKSVKYSVFVPILIKAIQELKSIIDLQSTEIASLKAQLNK